MEDTNPDMTYDLCGLLLHFKIKKTGNPLTKDEAIAYLVDNCHISGDLALSIVQDMADSGDLEKLNKGEIIGFKPPVFLFRKSDFFG